MPRKYTLKKRAEAQARTRLRIVEATVALHERLGPAKTSISAIAEKAGVRRATVYDHFPHERLLFEACTSHYLNRHPAPDPAAWLDLAPAVERLRVALTEVYAYHRSTEGMMTSVYRDMPRNPQLVDTDAGRSVWLYWQTVAHGLEEPWSRNGAVPDKVRAAIRHALEFPTWRSLVREQGLAEALVVELMVDLVACAAQDASPA